MKSISGLKKLKCFFGNFLREYYGETAPPIILLIGSFSI